METPLIAFRGVSKRFNEHAVLDGVDLEIYENQITTIIGKSGTGKSVLLKHIIGLLSPDEGTILFRGRPVQGMRRSEWDRYRSAISYMFQNNALFDSMTVFENVALPLRQTTDLGKREIREKVMARVEQMELGDVIHQYPSELSGGMQKRVAMARALVTDPGIVLFDEPTTGQDPIRKNIILSMIAHYRKKFKFTAVLVSHDIPDVFFISDRILLLWEGKVAFSGAYREMSGLKHPMITEYLESLEGLRDELTGLLSKEMFRSRYALMPATGESRGVALLFSIHLDIISDAIGAKAALKVLRTLGEYIDRYFSPLGGFSARHIRDNILTILPRTDLDEAGRLMLELADEMEKQALPGIRAAGGKDGGCFEIFVIAGMTRVSFSDDLDQIIERAAKSQEVIAIYQCGREERPT